MEVGKYSLKLRERLYQTNLYKSSFTHGCYCNVFTTCRKQSIFNHDGISKPLLNDFISINADDNLFVTQAYPKTKAFTIDSLDDVCLKMVREKQKYNKYFLHCQRKYKKQAKLINSNVKKRRSGNSLPLYMINLCNTKEPDPFFDTFYNWYYTGGILDTLSIDDRDYFIGILENDLCIRYLKNAKIKQKYPLNDSQIFNIKSYLHNNTNYVTLRGSNSLKLIKIELENVSLNETWQVFDKMPFIDCKFYSKNLIGSINMDNSFKSFDLEAQALLFEHKIQETTEIPNRFCLFNAINRKDILFMTREQIKLFDVRSAVETKVLSLENLPLSRCEELCNFIISKFDSNYIFACTSHSIIKADFRNRKIVKQWSHLLTSPPLMIDSHKSQHNEYICVSSSKDRIILSSTPEEVELPMLVPNPLELFNQINLQQPIIIEGLNKRLRASINGLKLVDNKICYSNAFGDIFCNDIQLKSDSQNLLSNSGSFEKMTKWVKHLQKRETEKGPKPLYATEIATDWSKIKQLHCKSILEQNLVKYKDETLVNIPLDVNPYEFDMSAIWGTKSEEIQLPEESSAVRKVTEWLNRDIS